MKYIKILFLLILGITLFSGCQKINLNEEIKKVNVRLNIDINQTRLIDVSKNNVVFEKYDINKYEISFDIEKKVSENKLIVKYKLVSKSNSSIQSAYKEKEFTNFLESSTDKLNKLIDKVTVELSSNISEMFLTNVTKEDVIFKNYPINDYEIDYSISKDFVNNTLKVTYKLKDKLDNSLVSKEKEYVFSGFKSDPDNTKDSNFAKGGTLNGYIADKYLFLLERFVFANKKNVYPSYQFQEEVTLKKSNIDLKLTLQYLNDNEGKIKYSVVGKYFDENVNDTMEITGFHVENVDYSINQNLAIRADSYVKLIEDKVTIEQYKEKSSEDILETLESLKLQDKYNNIIDVFGEQYLINITHKKISGNYLKMFFNISRKLYKYENSSLSVVGEKGIFNKEVELKYFDTKDILDYILSKVQEKVVTENNPSHLYAMHNAGISVIGHLFELEAKYEDYFQNKKTLVEILSISANDLDGELYVTYRMKIDEENIFSNNTKKTKFTGLKKVTEKDLKDYVYLIPGEDYLDFPKLDGVLKNVVNYHFDNHIYQTKKYDANDPLISRVFPQKSFYINPEAGFSKYTEGLKKKFVLTNNQNDIVDSYDEITKTFDINRKKIYFNNIYVEFTGVTIAYSETYQKHFVSANFKISLELLSANSDNNAASTNIEYTNNIPLRGYDKKIQ